MISSRLGQDDTVGILVQRIVRFTRIHANGYRCSRRSGKYRSANTATAACASTGTWKVNGHKLHHGKYLITLRGFDKHHVLLGTTKPATLTIH